MAGCVEGDGAYVGFKENHVFEKTGDWKPKGDKGSGGSRPQKVPYEYVTTLACPDANPDDPAGGNGCASALTMCAGQPNTTGPYSRVYRRLIGPGNERTPWDNIGATCWPQKVPGNTRPQLTLAMIREAWTHTPFSKPSLSMQPVGNRTLVTLPTYFQASWPTLGNQPDEVRTVTLVGQRVQIRPTFKQITYTFGDGTSTTTTSMGGVYPNGDVTHAYTNPGTMTVSANARYGGQFRLGGGAWVDIPGTTDIAGPTQQLQVLTAKNRLVNE
ncbi:hypothetical protein VV01_19775 [Luteipulveratus halotolerans]|uniref:PKD domain-containing protein n=1 Tax=Luteipulveratus halotolerans TaxID=1631356 RepID=A0A0L6CMI0_9MICO|nr:hypothetical protein VV01_19775 [Luteipulveratus halotolerans]